MPQVFTHVHSLKVVCVWPVSGQYGPGSRLIGLTHSGESYYFAKNNAELTDIQIAGAEKSVPEGDYRRSEFAGACWDPHGETLFVNMQSPGITFAITGPWN